MTWPTPFERARISLSSKRINDADAERQTRTAEEILRRLATQPGLVLADEVGMGKTFVALAVAMSVAWADKGKRPVVIMVPTSVLGKWEREVRVFEELCLTRSTDKPSRVGIAKNALEFFRLLDDPLSRRVRIILVSHGSFHRALQDPWIKLAILQMAMHHAKLGERRKTLPRFAADILRTKASYSSPELFQRLLETNFERWRDIIAKHGEDLGDDPIPEAITKALYKSQVDLSRLRETLLEIPLRKSEYLDDRLRDVRQALNESFQEIWHEALVNAHFRSPLLILDEAHHVKNPQTKLASLFVSEDDSEDGGKLAGALEGGFERMLFLTATPFQLGHDELLNVVDRFQGVDWKTLEGEVGEQRFTTQRQELRAGLDEAQRASLELDWHWGKLRRGDLGDITDAETEAWWTTVSHAPEVHPEKVQQVVRAERRAHTALRAAETVLRPWVIRHLRARVLPGTVVQRRQRLVGRGIQSRKAEETAGLPIEDSALLPFMLAARAQAMVSRRGPNNGATHRATFAEGLSSSYETFLETRTKVAEVDEASAGPRSEDPRLGKYLDRLQQALPTQDTFADHPKIAAVVRRVTDLWEQGEKVVVFCHYRVTGRALVKHLSNALGKRLWENAAKALGTSQEALKDRAQLWSEAFEADRPLGRTVRDATIELLSATELSQGEMDAVADIVRRFVRTPLYLARYVDLTADDRAAELERVLRVDDRESLRTRIATFARFVGDLTSDERATYLAALGRIHPGPTYEPPGDDERHGGAELLPNVRLASGAIRPEVRERLLMGFNTPFFPEVLVASSVMAEGVDLHLNCRHIIHHDLDWNPSVLEQRTGRVDRINSKAERVSKSIEVALPFVGGTQDEKMFRVVMDRERWFQVVMGEDFKTDELATEKIAERIPLPASVARLLSLRLEVAETNA